MTAANQEIVTAFETNGMTPDEIASEFEYEISAVKSILMQCSSQFRKDAKEDKSLDFTEQEYEDCRATIMNYARYGNDNPALQVKCALFVISDKKGYLDPNKHQLPTLNVNVLDFNSQMQKALLAQQRTMKRIVDVKQVTSNENDKEIQKVAA